jgi:hypothetical protein
MANENLLSDLAALPQRLDRITAPKGGVAVSIGRFIAATHYAFTRIAMTYAGNEDYTMEQVPALQDAHDTGRLEEYLKVLTQQYCHKALIEFDCQEEFEENMEDNEYNLETTTEWFSDQDEELNPFNWLERPSPLPVAAAPQA